MSTDASKVRVAVTGAIFKGPTTMTMPAGTSGAPAGAVDLGFISDDGVEIEMPDAGDSEPIKAWQNGTTVRIVRTPSDDLPTWQFTLLETKIETVETYFGITVTSSATEGYFDFVSTALKPHNFYVVDAIDGLNLLRDCISYGIVSSVGSHTLKNSDAIAYQVTVTGELDPIRGSNFRRYSTALKTPTP